MVSKDWKGWRLLCPCSLFIPSLLMIGKKYYHDCPYSTVTFLLTVPLKLEEKKSPQQFNIKGNVVKHSQNFLLWIISVLLSCSSYLIQSIWIKTNERKHLFTQSLVIMVFSVSRGHWDILLELTVENGCIISDNQYFGLYNQNY